MEDCVFCKIVAGKIPCEKVYENEYCLVFLDIKPVNKGHLLIIPKRHYADMLETPENVVSKIFAKSKVLMKGVKDAMKADYVAVSVVGMDVRHFHVHLIPRYLNDGMANFWPTKSYEESEFKDVSEKIRKSLEFV